MVKWGGWLLQCCSSMPWWVCERPRLNKQHKLNYISMTSLLKLEMLVQVEHIQKPWDRTEFHGKFCFFPSLATYQLTKTPQWVALHLLRYISVQAEALCVRYSVTNYDDDMQWQSVQVLDCFLLPKILKKEFWSSSRNTWCKHVETK